MYGMIELKMMHILTTKFFFSFSAHQIIEILSVLYSIYVIFRYQERFVFYVNNYIKQNQFNQSNNLDWIKKGMRNVNVVICKLKLALIGATNFRLEVAKKERQKREKIMKRQKTETMIVKQYKIREKIGFSSDEKNESDITLEIIQIHTQ